MGAGIGGVLDDMEIFTRPWDLPLENIAGPVRIWHGDNDRLVPLAGAKALSARIKGSQLQVVKKAGHFWCLEHFAEILRSLHAMAA